MLDPSWESHNLWYDPSYIKLLTLIARFVCSINIANTRWTSFTTYLTQHSQPSNLFYTCLFIRRNDYSPHVLTPTTTIPEDSRIIHQDIRILNNVPFSTSLNNLIHPFHSPHRETCDYPSSSLLFTNQASNVTSADKTCMRPDNSSCNGPSLVVHIFTILRFGVYIVLHKTYWGLFINMCLSLLCPFLSCLWFRTLEWLDEAHRLINKMLLIEQ
jgi:hypothetical protein